MGSGTIMNKFLQNVTENWFRGTSCYLLRVFSPCKNVEGKRKKITIFKQSDVIRTVKLFFGLAWAVIDAAPVTAIKSFQIYTQKRAYKRGFIHFSGEFCREQSLESTSLFVANWERSTVVKTYQMELIDQIYVVPLWKDNKPRLLVVCFTVWYLAAQQYKFPQIGPPATLVSFWTFQ